MWTYLKLSCNGGKGARCVLYLFVLTPCARIGRPGWPIPSRWLFNSSFEFTTSRQTSFNSVNTIQKHVKFRFGIAASCFFLLLCASWKKKQKRSKRKLRMFGQRRGVRKGGNAVRLKRIQAISFKTELPTYLKSEGGGRKGSGADGRKKCCIKFSAFIKWEKKIKSFEGGGEGRR